MKVNEAYELYCGNPTDENYAQLYNATREYALNIGHSLLQALGTYYRHACENAATTVLLSFSEKFDPKRASFSTWANQAIRADLIDWRRKKERLLNGESRYAEYVSILRASPVAADDQVLLDQILSRLSEDERRLLDWKEVDGASLRAMASEFGVSLATIKRRWDALVEKCRGIEVR
jgi:RNA polymerase sigma factor (sigma-70 family)